MGGGKIVENALRVKYIRLLERFMRSMMGSLLNDEELTKEKFDKKVENSYKYLEKMEKVTLYKEELVDLENLVKKICLFRQTEISIEEIRLEILRDAKEIEKRKNRNRYKRGKKTYKNEKWED